MINYDGLRKLIAELTAMTADNRIKWSGSDLICWKCHYRGFEIAVWWFQDDKPCLLINKESVECYGFGIEELLDKIREKDKAAKKARQELQRAADVEARWNAEAIKALNKEIEKFLTLNQKSKKPKRR